MAELKLFISGQQILFISANVSYSIDSLAHSFSASILNKVVSLPEPVQFYLDDQLIFSGQIDSASNLTVSMSTTQTINGRSLSAHMIDSRIKMDALYSQKFDQLLTKIVERFGLSVQNQVSGTMAEIPEFMINAESPLQNISQVAKQQGYVLSEKNGQIHIEKPGQFSTKNIALIAGNNLQDFSFNHDFTQRFYRYEIQGAWDDAEAIKIDTAAAKYRQKVIVSDKLQSKESCVDRAQYEHDLAIAQSLKASGTIPGLHPVLTGQNINQVIQLISEPDSFNSWMLISAISLTVDGSAHNTKIDLIRPFDQEVY